MNLMKGAVVLADAASTVSPTYAREVTSDPELGFGLEGVLRAKGERFVGILNGADYREWNPANDEFIAARYDGKNRRGKADCARDLREQIKLPSSAGRPLAGMVSRMTPQKGFDLLVDALPRMMAAGLELVILGSGDTAMQDYFKKAEQRYPDQLRTIIGFDNALAHKLQAGCDMFLMPSKFEPCGLTQMYALKYGTAPVVRATGGLADTIAEFEPKSGRGNGFVFRGYKSEELVDAVGRAVSIYRQRETWSRLMDNAFAADFSWQVAASRYLDLFARIESWRAPA
jgi:starch synthase